MGLGDLFKGRQYKEERDRLQQIIDAIGEDNVSEISSILEAISKKQNELQEKEDAISKATEELTSLETKIKKKQTTIAELDEISKIETVLSKKEKDIKIAEKKVDDLQKSILQKQSEIISLDDEILVQSFGLFKPRYEFARALDYKDTLSELRKFQKQLIKDGAAVTGATDWQVNGSKRQGTKMVNDMKKLLLRAFNNECDEVVSKVKYSNYEVSLKKIRNSANAISKLGSVMGISISQRYIDAKERELNLAFSYQQAKQREKEEMREAREREREAAKLQKEIEEERKKIKKEQKHYKNALSDIEKLLENDPDNIDLKERRETLISELCEIDKSLANIDYREANQRAGYVYVISNIGSFGEGIYKIGMTRRLDPQDRVDELGGASVPFNFDVHAIVFSDDAPSLEASLHKALEDKKVNKVNARREFFKVTLDEIKDVIRKNYDKTVEFKDIPDAEQYRVSLKMKGESQGISKENI